MLACDYQISIHLGILKMTPLLEHIAIYADEGLLRDSWCPALKDIKRLRTLYLFRHDFNAPWLLLGTLFNDEEELLMMVKQFPLLQRLLVPVHFEVDNVKRFCEERDISITICHRDCRRFDKVR